MPKVGGKKFGYSAKGKAAAKAHAKKTGQKMMNGKNGKSSAKKKKK